MLLHRSGKYKKAARMGNLIYTNYRAKTGKKTPPKDGFTSEALVCNKLKTGTSSRYWRSVARDYW
jgi:hypothetical protein